MIAAAPSVADIAAEAAAAGPIVETTHPQLTDKEVLERKKKFSKLAAAMARQKGPTLMYKATNPEERGDLCTEGSEGTETDGAVESSHSSS